MKKIYLLAIFLVLGLGLFAQTVTKVTKTILPLSNSLPVVYQENIKGGVHQVADLDARDALSANLKQTGMLVMLRDSHATYQWDGAAWRQIQLVRNWEVGSAYFTGDIFLYNGSIMIAKAAGTIAAGDNPLTDTANWNYASTGGWNLTGNAGTIPGTHFIGTTDDVDLVFKRNNLKSGTITTNNTALGYDALSSITTGNYNTVLGASALKSVTTKPFNTAIGYNAASGRTGESNTAVGSGALQGSGGGTGNTALGTDAGKEILNGGYNIAIGINAQVPYNAGSYQLSIGNSIYGVNMGSATRKIGIGLTSPTATLHLPAGKATAESAPLKLTSGTLLTTPETGAIEYDGTHFYGTVGTTRLALDNNNANGTADGNTLRWDNTAKKWVESTALTNNGTDITATGDVTVKGADLTLGDAATAASGKLVLNDATTGVNTATIAGPANASASYTLTLPNTQGASGQSLINDGSGNLNWGTANAWSLTGNAGTTPETHFIGTTDDKDLVFKRNNVQAGLIQKNNIAKSNNAFGEDALKSLTTGSNNQAFGSGALTSATTGSYNVGMGKSSLGKLTDASDNVAIGHNAGSYLNGGKNVSIGSNTLSGVSSGSTAQYNVAVGYLAARDITEGLGNVALGAGSLGFITSGDYNVALGMNANDNITSGNTNIAIGYGAKVPSATDDNQLSIGNSIYGLNMGAATRKIGIGLTAPAAALHLPAGTATAETAPLKLTSGTLLATPETGAIEYDGTHFYGTVGTTRLALDQEGLIQVTDLAARDALTAAQKVTGKIVVVQDSHATYQWDGTAWRQIQLVRNWEVGSAYFTGDIFLYNSNLVIAKTDGAIDSGDNPMTDSANWESTLGGNLAPGQILVGDGNGVARAVSLSGDALLDETGKLTVTTVNLSGDLTLDATGEALIGDDKVTSAKILDNTIATTDLANGAVTVAKISSAGAADKDKVLTTNTSGAPQWEARTNFASSILTAGHIFVGNSSGKAEDMPMSGDITIDDSGVTEIYPGVIEDGDVSSSAAIAGTKISPDFGTQNVTTTGNITGKKISIGQTNTWTLQNPATLAASYTLTLPEALGNDGQILKTDATGKLSWIDPVGLTKVTATMPAGANAALDNSAGGVNQVYVVDFTVAGILADDAIKVNFAAADYTTSAGKWLATGSNGVGQNNGIMIMSAVATAANTVKVTFANMIPNTQPAVEGLKLVVSYNR